MDQMKCLIKTRKGKKKKNRKGRSRGENKIIGQNLPYKQTQKLTKYINQNTTRYKKDNES